MSQRPSEVIAFAIIRWRTPLLTALALLSLVLGVAASDLRIDASFEKQLPLDHPFVETMRHYRSEFGGADRLLIAVRAREGDIFSAAGLKALERATDAVFFLPGIDRSSVRSLFTPDARFIEVVEDGFTGGNVIPSGFRPTPDALATVRANAIKAGLVGRLVADDFSAALVSAHLLADDPTTHQPVDHLAVARQLERRIRGPLVDAAIDIHIIGFAKAAGDIADGTRQVLSFFAVAVALTALVVLAATRSVLMTLLPLASAAIAVIWTLGLLALLGFGLDPMSVLLPFLIFAIGVSHGVQMVGAFRSEANARGDHRQAARQALALLLVPSGLALASDAAGFLSIRVIAIGTIRELAITMALGVAMLAVNNLLLLPLALSFVRAAGTPAPAGERLWRSLASVATPRRALLTVIGALLLLLIGVDEARHVEIGDLGGGVPALRPEARYNQDAAFIAEHFAIGVDVLQVMVETEPDACVDHEVMAEIDRFQWHMANLEGVRSTLSLPQLARTINAGWYEGNPKWRVLPRDAAGLAAAIGGVETSSGLLNSDCSVMPVLIFTEDHKATTIAGVISAVEAYEIEVGGDHTRIALRLASGNVAVLAATNDVVAAAQLPMLLAVYTAVAAFCLIGFRSLAATLCIVLPLGLVSVLVLALMSLLDIGLVPATLPVAALGVGIGVDYGIYVFARLRTLLAQGLAVRDAWLETLRVTGSAVLLTGSTLAIGVGSWVLADLQLQADMGLLLAFMLLANMIGALVLLPALATLLLSRRARNARQE